MNLDRFFATLFLTSIALIVVLYFQNKELVQSVFAHNEEHKLESYDDHSDHDDEQHDHSNILSKQVNGYSTQTQRQKAIRNYEIMLKAEGVSKTLTREKAPRIEEVNNQYNKNDRVWLKPDIYKLASAKVGDLLNIPLPKSTPRPIQEVIVRVTKKEKVFIANNQITSFKGYIANTDSQRKEVYISILGKSASIDIFDYDKVYSSSLTDEGGWLINTSKTFHNLNFSDDFIEVGKN